MRDLSAYILSLERILKFRDEIKEIYPCHGTYPIGMDAVPGLIDGARKVENGEITPVITEIFGKPVAEYDIGDNILLCDVKKEG